MHLITGSSTSNHVTSANDGIRNAHIFGKGSFVLKGFGDFTATKINDNTVRIGIGQGIINGRMFEMTSSENVYIANGTTGRKRIDLIIARYSIDTATGIESIALSVKQGGSTTGTPSEPAISSNNILNGATSAEMPLYRVLITGTAINSITKVYKYKENISENLEGTKAVTLEGSYNLIDFPFVNGSKTISGITILVNDDGSITANGTATANVSFVMMMNKALENNALYRTIPNCSHEESTSISFQVYTTDWSMISWFKENEFFRASSSKLYSARIAISNGTIVNNVTWKPMLVKVADDGSYPTDFVRNNIKSNRELTDAINSMLASGEPFLANGKWVYEEKSGSTDGSGWYNLPTDYNKYTFIIACPLISGFQCKITKSSTRWVVRCVDAITTTLSGTSYSLDVGCKTKDIKIGLLMFESAAATQNFDEE